jgi:hypothetical protein
MLTNYELKLVPVNEPNADGRFTVYALNREPEFGEVIDKEFVVCKKREQPGYMHGSYSTPEKTFILKDRHVQT